MSKWIKAGDGEDWTEQDQERFNADQKELPEHAAEQKNQASSRLRDSIVQAVELTDRATTIQLLERYLQQLRGQGK